MDNQRPRFATRKTQLASRSIPTSTALKGRSSSQSIRELLKVKAELDTASQKAERLTFPSCAVDERR
jgi:hypothetical protein